MRLVSILLLLLATYQATAQTSFKDGLPNDLDKEKLIILKHDKVKVTGDKNGKKADRYLHLRQSNHNKVLQESNKKLVVAALEYPFQYAFATKKSYKNLIPAGYKYVLISQVYENEHLKKEQTQDELIVFEYFLLNVEENIAYKVFELDEMKVYDSKLMIKRLNKKLKEQYPENF